jgi:leucyl aminopeptidase
MIGPKAFVASDILTAFNGKTIDVVNTDAEGRLALVYADKEIAGSESIIELSTLTGSCMVSLAKQICGIWTLHHQMAAELEAASSKIAVEKSWRMPMAMEYKDQLNYIDIAGPLWDDKRGATGFGVKPITEWVSAEAERADRASTNGNGQPGAATA